MWLRLHSASVLFAQHPLQRATSPCALHFLSMQVCSGGALQLIRDLPVEFHCNKGSYSCRQDGEKAALAALIALLRGVSKMKRLDFEGFHRRTSSRLNAAQPSVPPPSTPPLSSLRFCHLSSSVALQYGRVDLRWPLSQTVSTGAK